MKIMMVNNGTVNVLSGGTSSEKLSAGILVSFWSSPWAESCTADINVSDRNQRWGEMKFYLELMKTGRRSSVDGDIVVEVGTQYSPRGHASRLAWQSQEPPSVSGKPKLRIW